MSQRNWIWLALVALTGIFVGRLSNNVWLGLAAAAAVLVLSEFIERRRRAKLRAARGVTDAPSVKDAITARRKKR